VKAPFSLGTKNFIFLVECKQDNILSRRQRRQQRGDFIEMIISLLIDVYSVVIKSERKITITMESVRSAIEGHGEK